MGSPMKLLAIDAAAKLLWRHYDKVPDHIFSATPPWSSPFGKLFFLRGASRFCKAVCYEAYVLYSSAKDPKAAELLDEVALRMIPCHRADEIVGEADIGMPERRKHG